MNATSILASSPPSILSNWGAMLAALGLTSSRQAEAAVLSQLMTSFLGLIATGKIIPFIAPVIVSYIVLPLMMMLKSIAKALLLLGITAWLIGTLVPFSLAYFGMAGAGAFVARSFEKAAGPYSVYIDMGPQSLVTKALRYADMDNLECRMQLACKAGELTADTYPNLVKFVNDTGIINIAENQARYDPYTSLAIKALRGKIMCEQELSPCTGLYTIETLFDNEKVATMSQKWMTSYLQPFTTTTTTPAPTTAELSSNDMVVNAIKRLAQTYYSYST